MFYLNNKGQSLVLFVVLMPIFIFIMTLVFDIGNALFEKNRLSNTSYMAISYGLDNIEIVNEGDLIELIMENIDDLNNISVLIKDNVINIKVSKDIKGTIGKLFGFDLITANCEYEGFLLDNKKVIERIKWYYG